MDRPRLLLLGALTAHAEHGRPCPSLTQLAQSMRISATTVSVYLRDLRAAGAIQWRVKNLPHFGQVRIVTICETGKSTTEPVPPGKRRKGAAPEVAPYTPTPNALTSAGRKLVGAEFRRRAAVLMKRDAAERARGGAA